jgi:hypothetical protein
MLQAHSLLWHYLWAAPNLLLLLLAFILWKRGTFRQFPAFFAFATLGAVGELGVYAAVVLPIVSPVMYWRTDWANLILEAVLKFALIGEIFSVLVGAYASLARLGKNLICSIGVILIFTAVILAAYAPLKAYFRIVYGDNLLRQTTFFVETGVLLFIFLFSSYFRLHWPPQLFGIALGLSISACVHLATWASIDNAGFTLHTRTLLSFLNMATYHFCVLVWCYYLLVPQELPVQSAVPLSVPENNLAVWNRELERLLHK